MKFSSSQLAYLVRNREARGNLRALLKYVLTLVAVITLYAVVFHVIKMWVEGEQHSASSACGSAESCGPRFPIP